MIIVKDIFLLLLVFQVKHFLADFPLQTKSMLGKFDLNPRVWIPALTSHCLVHQGFTFTIVLAYTRDWRLALSLCCLDFWAHFFMDMIKANPILLGRFAPLNWFEIHSFKEALNKTPENENVQSLWAKRQTDNRIYWYGLGFDQMWHHLTHYFIIWRVLS